MELKITTFNLDVIQLLDPETPLITTKVVHIIPHIFKMLQ